MSQLPFVSWEDRPLSDELATPGTVHLWVAVQSEIIEKIDLADLSDQERQRAEKCQSDKARREFLVSRWSTRNILSRYLGTSPADHRFSLSTAGKPSLATDLPLHFNRSHSGDYWILAISQSDSVGVDIEEIRARAQLPEIVQRWFSNEFLRKFEALSESEKLRFFYEEWVQREAVLKAHGCGISHLSEYDRLDNNFNKTTFTVSPSILGCLALPRAEIAPAPLFFKFSG